MISHGRHLYNITHLADALEDTDCVLEVTNMENRNDKLDEGIVPYTINRIQAASLTERILL